MAETYSLATVVRVDGGNPNKIPSGDTFHSGPNPTLSDSVASNPGFYQQSGKSFLALNQDGSTFWAKLIYGANGEQILTPA